MSGAIGNTEYPIKHSGTLLVVGSAPCVFDDMGRFVELDDDPTVCVMAVNEGAAVVKCNFIASLHVENMGKFRRLQDTAYPDSDYTTHAACPDAYFPEVDYYWRNTHTGATSAWCAVLIGKEMGFKRIILCGCPMNGGDGYAIDTKIKGSGKRFGFATDKDSIVRSHKRALEEAVKGGQGRNVFSMSGFTKELLGEPTDGHTNIRHCQGAA